MVHLTFLCLGFHICQMGIKIAVLPQLDIMHKVLRIFQVTQCLLSNPSKAKEVILALSLTYPVSIISLMQTRNGNSEILSNLLKVTQLKERLGRFSVSPLLLSCTSLLRYPNLSWEGDCRQFR